MPPSDEQRGGAWIATISAVIVIAAFVASKAARDAILLARFDIKSLPIFIAISAATSLPVIVLAGRLMARFGPARLIPVVNVASAALAVGEWFVLQRYPRVGAVMAYFHLATAGAVLVSGFWSIVNERFDVQTAKRHISRIGIGATLGGIFGGVIAERSAVHLAPDAILLVLAGLQLACAVTLGLLARGERGGQRPADGWLALREASRSPLLRTLGGIVILGAVAAGVMDYVFKADIVAATTHDGLLRSLAIFYTVTSVVTAIVQVVACGPLIARLGVPRSVATLPFAVTGFSLLALVLRVPIAAAVARGAEVVTRNSIYRAGYELIYAPLGEDHKRPAKVVLDVGADRVGDLLGAQLVALIVYAAAEPRLGLLVAATCVGLVSIALAIRLPRRYTAALEDSLLERAAEPRRTPPSMAAEPEPWVTLDNLPSFGQAGEFAPLSLRFRAVKPSRRGSVPPPAAVPPASLAVIAALPAEPPPTVASAPLASPTPLRGGDAVADSVADLRSGDPARIQRAFAAGLTPELAAHAIDLIGRDDLSRAATTALIAVAPRCTGMFVDALLDPDRDITVRRRLPGVLLAGEPSLSAWGLWRALDDPSFDVRYRSGAVLARLAAQGHLRWLSSDDVFDAVRRELGTDDGALAAGRAFDALASTEGERPQSEPALARPDAGLEHVFTVLGLALPAEPLRIALHAVHTDDAELRGTALEYLESILPADVRAQLWPLLEGVATAPAASESPLQPAAPASHHAHHEHHEHPMRTTQERRAARSHDEILEALHLSYPRVLDKLRQRVKPA